MQGKSLPNALLIVLLVGCGGSDTPSGPAFRFTLTGVVRQSGSGAISAANGGAITAASHGAVIPDATVEIVEGSSAGQSTRTDAEGRYALALIIEGDIAVRASHPGYPSRTEFLSFRQDTTLDFELTPGQATVLKGRVVSTITGEPVANATVDLAGLASDRTAADGTFSIPSIREGFDLFEVVVDHPSYWRRETGVSIGRELEDGVEIDLLPKGDGFKLSDFNHVFRFRGTEPTLRWEREPALEIWTEVYRVNEDQRVVASSEKVPAEFIDLARSVFRSDTPIYTDGQVQPGPITVRSAEPGTFLPQTVPVDVISIVVFDNQTEIRSTASIGRDRETGEIQGALIAIHPAHIAERGVYSHELAHALGWSHPGVDVPVPFSSIMNKDVSFGNGRPTALDHFYGSVLHRRPAGNRTPDKDRAGYSVNALAFGRFGSGQVERTHICWF